MQITKAKKDDLPEILGMYEILSNMHTEMDTYYPPYEFYKEKFEGSLIEKNSHLNILVLVAKEGDRTLGFLISEIKDRSRGKYNSIFLQVSGAFVKTDYRGKGVLRALLQETKEFAKKENITRIELNVDTRNENALIEYEKLGFNEIPKTLKIDL